MARRRRRSLDEPLSCVIGGRLVLVLTYFPSGSVCDPRPAMARLTPAQKEECAAWVATRHVPKLRHDDAYKLLFS